MIVSRNFLRFMKIFLFTSSQTDSNADEQRFLLATQKSFQVHTKVLSYVHPEVRWHHVALQVLAHFCYERNVQLNFKYSWSVCREVLTFDTYPSRFLFWKLRQHRKKTWEHSPGFFEEAPPTLSSKKLLNLEELCDNLIDLPRELAFVDDLTTDNQTNPTLPWHTTRSFISLRCTLWDKNYVKSYKRSNNLHHYQWINTWELTIRIIASLLVIEKPVFGNFFSQDIKKVLILFFFKFSFIHTNAEASFHTKKAFFFTKKFCSKTTATSLHNLCTTNYFVV